MMDVRCVDPSRVNVPRVLRVHVVQSGLRTDVVKGTNVDGLMLNHTVAENGSVSWNWKGGRGQSSLGNYSCFNREGVRWWKGGQPPIP